VLGPTPLGRTDSPGGEGDGGSIFWKTREIGLPSYSKICTLWFRVSNNTAEHRFAKRNLKILFSRAKNLQPPLAFCSNVDLTAVPKVSAVAGDH
jgi:hypothetical protein